MYGVGGFLGFVSWISSAAFVVSFPFSGEQLAACFFPFSRIHGRWCSRAWRPCRDAATQARLAQAEAGSSSRSTVKLWCSKQARERDHLSRSSGWSAWAGFNELHEVLFPHTMRCQEADAELLTAERAVAAGEEGTADRLAATKDHAYAHACRKSAEKFYLGLDD